MDKRQCTLPHFLNEIHNLQNGDLKESIDFTYRIGKRHGYCSHVGLFFRLKCKISGTSNNIVGLRLSLYYYYRLYNLRAVYHRPLSVRPDFDEYCMIQIFKNKINIEEKKIDLRDLVETTSLKSVREILWF